MKRDRGNWPGILGIFAIFGATAFLLTPDVNADSFDWRNVNGVNWVTSVKNQGNQEPAGTLQAAGILEAKYMLTRDDTTYQPDVSEQQLLLLVWEAFRAERLQRGRLRRFDGRSTGIRTALHAAEHLAAVAFGFRLAKSSIQSIERLYHVLPRNESQLPQGMLEDIWPTDDPVRRAAGLVQSSGQQRLRQPRGRQLSDIKTIPTPPAADTGSSNSWGSWWNGDGNHNGYGEIAYASEPSYSDWSWLWIYNHDVTGLTGNVCFTGPMATVTWNGGSGVWSLGGSSWSGTDMYGNSLPSYAWNNSEALATFNPSGATNITISGPVVAHGVIIASGATGYVFNGSNGGVLTTTGSGIVAHESTHSTSM